MIELLVLLRGTAATSLTPRMTGGFFTWACGLAFSTHPRASDTRLSWEPQACTLKSQSNIAPSGKGRPEKGCFTFGKRSVQSRDCLRFTTSVSPALARPRVWVGVGEEVLRVVKCSLVASLNLTCVPRTCLSFAMAARRDGGASYTGLVSGGIIQLVHASL